MEAPDFSDLDAPEARIKRLRTLLADSESPVLLAGSSMGGYVAAAQAETSDVRGLFLLAPAFYMPGYEKSEFPGLPKNLTVVHGWEDDTVPPDNVIRFAREHDARLHILPDGHRLSNSLDELSALFAQFLSRAGGQS